MISWGSERVFHLVDQVSHGVRHGIHIVGEAAQFEGIVPESPTAPRGLPPLPPPPQQRLEIGDGLGEAVLQGDRRASEVF